MSDEDYKMNMEILTGQVRMWMISLRPLEDMLADLDRLEAALLQPGAFEHLL